MKEKGWRPTKKHKKVLDKHSTDPESLAFDGSLCYQQTLRYEEWKYIKASNGN